MILPPTRRGVAFGNAADGDGRRDPAARARITATSGAPARWAWMRQVHGSAVLSVEGPGLHGPADGLVTTTPGLALVAGTADCFPVAVIGAGIAGIAHAGWRGAAAGVVPALLATMVAAGGEPVAAAIGPGIGPCCFEVGPEVTARFPDHTAITTWGAASVDLRAVIRVALAGLDVWVSEDCTRCGSGYHSHRRDRGPHRQVGLAWIPD
jgi:YfiH family protein